MLHDNSLDDVLDASLPAYAAAPRWWVGFSGGMDSMVLLQLLASWCSRYTAAPPLCAIHINHQMQKAASDWQACCEHFCDERGIQLQVHRVEVQGGSEADARQARYAVFEKVVGVDEVLFLAHHLDDQVETFFLRLLRGAGLDGLAAMPASRELGRGTLARPLLTLSRAAIADYAKRNALPFVTDPSNADTAIDRNFLRAEVLPLLSQRWPGYRTTVVRAASHLQTAASALAQSTAQPTICTSITGDCGIALSQLCTANVDEAARALRGWLRQRGLRAPDLAPLQEFLRQLGSAGDASAPRLQTRDYTLVRFGDGVFVLPDHPSPPPAEFLTLQPGESRQVAGVGECGLHPVGIEAELHEGALLLREDDTLSLRWRRGGERCRPQGRGGSTSLKQFLQELGVPPWWRDRVPLFYLDDELLAIGGLALCQSSRLFSVASARAVGRTPALWRPVWQREITAAD